MKRYLPFLMYLSALLLFGLNGIVASRINMPSHEIVFFRTGIAGIALTVLFVAMDAKFTFWRHPRAFAALCVSGIAMGVSWMFLYEAYRLMGVGVASLFYYCGPVVVMAMSPLLFGERLTKAALVAAVKKTIDARMDFNENRSRTMAFGYVQNGLAACKIGDAARAARCLKLLTDKN